MALPSPAPSPDLPPLVVEDAAPADWLSTDPRMTAAHRLYGRLGFTRLPERNWSPRPGIDLLVYALEL